MSIMWQREDIEWRDEMIRDLRERNAKLVAALEVADEAINPVDLGGISLDIWQARLKKTTKIIREALSHQQSTEKP